MCIHTCTCECFYFICLSVSVVTMSPVSCFNHSRQLLMRSDRLISWSRSAASVIPVVSITRIALIADVTCYSCLAHRTPHPKVHFPSLITFSCFIYVPYSVSSVLSLFLSTYFRLHCPVASATSVDGFTWNLFLALLLSFFLSISSRRSVLSPISLLPASTFSLVFRSTASHTCG